MDEYNSADLKQQLDKMREVVLSTKLFCERMLTRLEQRGKKPVTGEGVNAFSFAAVPDWELRQRLQACNDALETKPSQSRPEKTNCDIDEDLIQNCIEVIRAEQNASVSLLQRRLRLGYTRAAAIMAELESRGIVGPNRGADPREILIGSK